MTKQEIKDRLIELKSDYARIQGDLEKMEATVGNSASGENILIQMEEEISHLQTKLKQMP